MAKPLQKNHALITGATGISGWSLMRSCLDYPSRDTFAHVTGIVNRQTTLADSDLPTNDPRLRLICGVDLNRSPSAIASVLKSAFPDACSITHVFLTAYSESHDPATQLSVNTAVVVNAAQAVVELTRESGTLKHMCLQTGGKWYGLEHVPKIPYPVPVREDFPRVGSPYGSEIFYYAQWDALAAVCDAQNSAGPKWTISDVRPDGILGYCPRSRPMNLALGIGMFLSLWRRTYGRGSACPFPGSDLSWQSKFTNTSQDVLSRLEIWAALGCGEGDKNMLAHPHFNAADYDEPSCWADKWSGLCSYWGLEGIGPVPGTTKLKGEKDVNDPIGDFMLQRVALWRTMAKEQDLRSVDWVEGFQWMFIWWCYMHMDWDRQYDMSRVRKAGFAETKGVLQGYLDAWDKMRELAVLPRCENWP